MFDCAPMFDLSLAFLTRALERKVEGDGTPTLGGGDSFWCVLTSFAVLSLVVTASGWGW